LTSVSSRSSFATLRAINSLASMTDLILWR
jgi:hypothetical protein